MASCRTKHVVLFPIPGQGHFTAFLSLARLLSRELPDAAVTLVSTPRNVAALRSSTAPDRPPPALVGLHALPFVSADHGLPADCESMSSLPVPAFIKLFEAFEALEPAFDAYISGLLAGDADVCVVADVFAAWTAGVARRRGCAHAVFVSCGAFGAAVLHALWRSMPALPLGADDVLRLPEHPALALHRSQVSPTFFLDGDAGDRLTAFFRRLLQHGDRTDAVVANTVEELEREGLAMLRRAVGGVPVWPIGPLVRGAGDDDDDDSKTDENGGGVLRWLDAQPASSVLYISFGSQNTIRQNQMVELAAALESTGRPFVWAVRPPVGRELDGEWLPEGFEARARAEKRGVVVRGWAPQVRILAHGATAAFVSHCGWNSALESLAHGVPIIGWPLAAEQFYNAMVLAEEWGVCVEAARGNDVESSGLVGRSKLAAVVEAVMGDTAEAAAMRRRVAEVQQVMRDAWAEDGGSSRTALHAFFSAMNLTH
ncbi:hypothetical protein ACP4OV_012028 [Aristida adscensionis]